MPPRLTRHFVSWSSSRHAKAKPTESGNAKSRRLDSTREDRGRRREEDRQRDPRPRQHHHATPPLLRTASRSPSTLRRPLFLSAAPPVGSFSAPARFFFPRVFLVRLMDAGRAPTFSFDGGSVLLISLYS